MNKKDYIIPALALLFIIVLLLNGPIPQNPDYHTFADGRSLFGIPNFLNVTTNLLFGIVALLGLCQVKNTRTKGLKNIILALFTGFLLLTLGSGYYHWKPNNLTLVYDRVPMVIIFMSFFALIIYDGIGPSAGYRAFLIFNMIGLMTVFYWLMSEIAGEGDLRWYAMVQFFPLIAIPLILSLYHSTFNHWKYVVPIFLLFGVAKVCETYDKEIYSSLNYAISGHSLKHIFMAAAGYGIVLMVRRRLKAEQGVTLL